MMKKLLLLVAAVGTLLSARADEGMWLLPYLQKMNIQQMKERGCKLSAEEIYSINNSSLKDAIIIFGGGCTGEIVSSEGLIFTNHHCGYGAIQSLSSLENDYLKYGFWARSNAEELPVQGLSVSFVRQISDVSAEVLGNIPSIAGQEEFERIARENIEGLTAKMEAENPGKRVVISSFFGGNQYFAFVYEVYTDVRLVGTPPSSIGKFGGDTDNWMWPRHTGDFSIFRVYADADNRPAAYSPENKPYRAETFLKVSAKGVEENDFAMVMGFPGSTQRYMTSYEIDQLLTVDNPQRIFIRGERQEILWAAMSASDEIRIKYASKYAGSSNYWKNSIGMSRGIEKLNVKARKQEQEAAFQQWAQTSTFPEEGFQTALSKIQQAVAMRTPIMAARQYIREAFNSIELVSAAAMLNRMPMERFFKNYDVALDRKVAKRMLTIARENMKPEDLPSIYVEVIDPQFGGNSDAYVDWLYDTSVFTSPEKLAAASDEQKNNDPVQVLAQSIREASQRGTEELAQATKLYNEGHRLYIKGLMQMQPDKAWASDANFTIRLTYGRVLPYQPADGVLYKHYTTLKGVMEKEDPNNPMEFTVPDKLKELYAAGDFGAYANAEGEMPVCFLADLDITGGNSGSPVLNDRGELIGLAFDGNWEAMSGDVAFEPQLQRCIAVDARYVLFIIDKFAGAQWLIDELEIVK